MQHKIQLERHKAQYGRMSRQASAVGGFASKGNLAYVKKKGRGEMLPIPGAWLSVLTMEESTCVYKSLRNFRAGIVTRISNLKHAFGRCRCTWNVWEGFGWYA